jgi:hypothetical protein
MVGEEIKGLDFMQYALASNNKANVLLLARSSCFLISDYTAYLATLSTDVQRNMKELFNPQMKKSRHSM